MNCPNGLLRGLLPFFVTNFTEAGAERVSLST